MKVEVTQAHITKGRRLINKGEKANECCPIALALKETFAPRQVSAGFTSAIFTINNRDVYVDFPQKAVDFITAFDNGKTVKPFFFNLAAPR